MGLVIILKHSKLFPWSTPIIRVNREGIETNKWKISWDDIKDIDGWDRFISKGMVPLVLKINTIQINDCYLKLGTRALAKLARGNKSTRTRFYLLALIGWSSPHPTYIFIMSNKLLRQRI